MYNPLDEEKMTSENIDDIYILISQKVDFNYDKILRMILKNSIFTKEVLKEVVLLHDEVETTYEFFNNFDEKKIKSVLEQVIHELELGLNFKNKEAFTKAVLIAREELEERT